MPALLAALAACAALAAPTSAQTPAPVVTIGDATASEGNVPGTRLSFPISADNFTGTLTLVVATRPGTAVAPDDFTARLAVFQIPGLGVPNTNYRFEVPITADLVPEPTETMTVAYRVIAPGDPVPAPGTPGVNGVPDLAAEPTAATGTIVDDDAPASSPGAGVAPPPPVAPAAAPPTPAASPPVAAVSRPKFTQVATMPSTRTCVSRRSFRIRIRSPKGAQVASATVRLRGKTVATRKGKRVTAPIDLRGLPKGTFKVTIRVVLADGRVVTGSRTYRTCAPKREKAKTPKV